MYRYEYYLQCRDRCNQELNPALAELYQYFMEHMTIAEAEEWI